MKKWIALLCLSVWSVAASAATMSSNPQYLVYDFKASIQRLDLMINTIKYSLDTYDTLPASATLDCTSYAVKSDSLKGFLFVPICISCTTNGRGSPQSRPFGWDYSILEKDNSGDSVMYLMRGGDKSLSIWKAYADVDAGLFNKGVGARPFDTEDFFDPKNFNDDLAYMNVLVQVDEMGDPILDQWGDFIPGEDMDDDGMDDWDTDIAVAFVDVPTWAPTSLKKLKGAWMEVYFGVGDQFDKDGYVWGNYGVWPYGFLGHGSSYAWFDGTGFGTAAQLTQAAFCKPATTCFTVGGITGSMVGFVWHKNVCRVPPIWDVCSLEMIRESRINGTWSVKLNHKLTTTALEYNLNQFYPGDPAEAALMDDLFGAKKWKDLIWAMMSLD